MSSLKKSNMHKAISATPLLTGRKEPVDALLVHAGQLFLGGPHSSIAAYSLPEKTNSNHKETVGSPKQHSKPSNIPLWTVRLSKSTKTVDQLHVIREANLLVALSDGVVSLHDLAMVQDTGKSSSYTSNVASASPVPSDATTVLVQTKGAISLALDTSIQRAPDQEHDRGAGPWGAGYRHRAGKSSLGRAYRPSDTTLGRVGPNWSGSSRPQSLWGMEDVKRNRENERRYMTTNARMFLDREGLENSASPLGGEEDGVMSVVTTLIVGSRRKIVAFRWVDGAFWDTKEIVLPHTPRTLAFPTPTSVFMGYSSSEYAILSVPLASSSSVTDVLKPDLSSATIPSSSVAGSRVDLYDWKLDPISIPQSGAINDATDEAGSGGSRQGPALPASSSNMTMAGAFSGIGGYIGMSYKNRPLVLHIEGGEVLVCRDSMGIFLNDEGKPTRREGIEWPAVPDEVVFIKPFLFALLPPTSKQAPQYPTLQIRSANTLVAVQTLAFPPMLPVADQVDVKVGNAPSVKLLTPSAGAKPPIYVKVSPTERGSLEKDGLSIWCLDMKSWGEQIDELVNAEEYQEALALLNSIDDVLLEDKVARRTYVEGLYAVSLFSHGRYDEAIEHFIGLETNPARVIAMYPSYISGPLAHSRDEWYSLFGKTDKQIPPLAKDQEGGVSDQAAHKDIADSDSIKSAASQAIPRDRSRLAGLWGRRPQSVVTEQEGSLASSPAKSSSVKAIDDSVDNTQARSDSGRQMDNQVEGEPSEETQTASGPTGPTTDDERRAVDALGRFLADRRRIFKPILEMQPSSHSITLSQTRRDPTWLLAIPSKPLHELDTEQLTAVAQTVDTALFKTFLATKPGLLGPLCRVENWCEVDQVEELLLRRKRYTELIFLYGGKEMHDKALQLLRKLSQEKEDIHDKVEPTVHYLQELDADHIDVILEAAHWVLSIDAEIGMEVRSGHHHD